MGKVGLGVDQGWVLSLGKVGFEVGQGKVVVLANVVGFGLGKGLLRRANVGF